MVSGMLLTMGGFTGEILGGALSVTGIGAALGVPAMAVSAGLIAGGVGNMAAGIWGLGQALSEGGGSRSVEKTVTNSAGKSVTRTLVKNEDALLQAAEDAAGGKLDAWREFKPNWWKSPDGKTKIEFNLHGHRTTNEGPHVTVHVADGKGGWSVVKKAFIEGRESFGK